MADRALGGGGLDGDWRDPMSQESRRTVISRPGAAIRVERIEIPEHIRAAIAAALEQGKRDAQARKPWWKFWR